MERLDHLLRAGMGLAGLIFFMRMRKRLLDAGEKSHHKALIKKSPRWAQNIAYLLLFLPLCLGICVELFRIFDPGFILPQQRMAFVFSAGCFAGLMLLALGIKIYAMFSKKQVKE